MVLDWYRVSVYKLIKNEIIFNLWIILSFNILEVLGIIYYKVFYRCRNLSLRDSYGFIYL